MDDKVSLGWRWLLALKVTVLLPFFVGAGCDTSMKLK